MCLGKFLCQGEDDLPGGNLGGRRKLWLCQKIFWLVVIFSNFIFSKSTKRCQRIISLKKMRHTSRPILDLMWLLHAIYWPEFWKKKKKKMFSLEIIKSCICWGGVSKPNALLLIKCAHKKVPMTQMARKGPAVLNSKQ